MPGGAVIGTLGAITDISERKQALAALAESQHRLQALFDNAQDTILLMDDQGRYVGSQPCRPATFWASPARSF
jgi:PAS domain-containing protein